ncbi:exodeoxyribonuclease VII, small subunit [[Bacteroides] pectinophilus ATCC 43243]|uniref:Exodeoxyribonuclease VII small subunit n=1 Tax=[Bacteroides] pectinophilus ATCC 43243 TaxID=483218 RepID=B7AN32_9FIRM|nr:exodeoxyribonuclease VII, small subunit [[Bacteroides] pectinophilus ATCC 43243]
MAKAATVEESFAKLDEIISQLESGALSLDDSFKKYNEGMKLIKSCNQQLDKVENR